MLKYRNTAIKLNNLEEFMLITQEEYDRLLKGFYINGVAIRDTGYVCFTAREKRGDIDPVFQEPLALKKFVTYFYDEPLGEQWGAATYEGMDKLISVTTTIPLSQYIGIDMGGQVYVLGSGVECLEDDIPGEHTIFGARTIGGKAYVTGGGRYVARRINPNVWEILRKGIKKPTREEHLYTAGFDCVDGFSETDIYAGGGKGDLWHFNGETWKQISFPNSIYIESICCGGDGYVYIGAQSGMVFKGRDQQWVTISQGGLSLPFRQMVWYQDRIWATSDYGVWHIYNDEVITAELPDEVRMCSGYICCNDKTLVIAGLYGAARLENGKWDILVNCIQAEKTSE
ncbi:hypothetical protein RCS94_05630 [Orbaceae bacterium ac157xtp]